MARIAPALATAAALTLASASWASPITLQYTGYVSGPAPTGNITNTVGPLVNQAVAAAQFNFNVISDPGNVYWDSTLQAFCIDIANNLHTSNNPLPVYNLVAAPTVLSQAQLARIGQLYDNPLAQTGTAQADAAFQLALWEIVYEQANQLKLDGNGNFTSANFSGARGLANGWLAGIDLNSNVLSTNWQFYALTPVRPEVNQMLLIARRVEVSEPGTVLLLVAGLGLAAAGLRRRTVNGA